MYPLGLVVNAGGNVYVADTMNGRIRKITPDGVVSTWPNNSTYFQKQRALALGLDGTTLYIAEASQKIRQMTAAGVVSLLAGSGQAGSQDGLGNATSSRCRPGLARGHPGGAVGGRPEQPSSAAHHSPGAGHHRNRQCSRLWGCSSKPNLAIPWGSQSTRPVACSWLI